MEITSLGAGLSARPNSILDQIWGEEEDEKTREVQRPRKRNAKTGTNSIATERGWWKRGIVIVESAMKTLVPNLCI